MHVLYKIGLVGHAPLAYVIFSLGRVARGLPFNDLDPEERPMAAIFAPRSDEINHGVIPAKTICEGWSDQKRLVRLDCLVENGGR